MRNIRQNLFFAFVYNMLGVPIAAGALYPAFVLLLSPIIASAAMTFSSVSVIANALRLNSEARWTVRTSRQDSATDQYFSAVELFSNREGAAPSFSGLGMQSRLRSARTGHCPGTPPASRHPRSRRLSGESNRISTLEHC